MPGVDPARGRPAIIVNDLVSSGSPLIAFAARRRDAGIAPSRAADSVSARLAAIPFVPVLGDAARALGWMDGAR
ncbi:hypothetical protein ACT17R_08765 [Sphingopyxis sp. Q841]|uniref:hypothetical protein n=1 Tax=Sphingopyxis sp. Q841 TaxID=3458250 RepID=UPI0040375148